MVVPTSTSRSRIYNSYRSIHLSFPSSKGWISVMCWQWYYHFTPLFALGKRIVIPYVPQSTYIVNVSDSIRFSHCITTVYSRVSKENGNWFFWWNVPSTNNNFICFGYILTQRLPRLWRICCIFGGRALNENQNLVISNSNKASMPKCLCAKMSRIGYWL